MSESEDIAELLRLEKVWMEAWVRKNRTALEALLTEDFTMRSAATDDLIDREEWVRAAMGPATVESFHFADFHLQVYGDAAVVHSRFSQKGSTAGNEWSGEFFLTDVWVRFGGHWRVASRHSSRPTGVTGKRAPSR